MKKCQSPVPRRHPSRCSPCVLLLSLLLVLMRARSTAGATVTKADNNAAMNQAISWISGGPPGSNDIARFDANVTSAKNAPLGADTRWAGLLYVNPIAANTIPATGGFTLTLGDGGIDMSAASVALTISANTALGSTQAWTIASARTLTLGGALSGSATLTKSGPGTLLLNGANGAFSGDLLLTSGTLSGNAAGLGDPTGNIFITSNATMTATTSATIASPRRVHIASGATATFSPGGSIVLTLGGPLDGSGDLAMTGAGTLALPGANTNSGNMVVSAGALRAVDGVGVPAGATAGNLALNGGIWESGADINRVLGSGPGQVQVPGGASGFSAFGGPVTITLDGGGTVTWGGGAFAPTTLALNTAGATDLLTWRNDLNLNSTSTRTIAVAAGSAQLAGTVGNSLAGGLTKTGAGTLWLTGTNTYAGLTAVNSGALRARDGVGLPPAGALLLAGGVWDVDQDITRPLGAGAGQLSVGAGASGFSAFGAPVTVSLSNGVALTWGSGNFAPTTALVLNGITATHKLTFRNAVNFGAAVRTVQVVTNTAEMAGTLSGSAGLTKSGAGLLLLSGTNAWSAGATTVSDGTLRLAASNAIPPGALTIAAGAVLDLQSFDQTVGAVSFNQGTIIGSGMLVGSGYTLGTGNTSGSVDVRLGGSGVPLSKVGTGTYDLTATNDYSGTLWVQDGILQVAVLGEAVNGTGAIRLGSGTTASGELAYSGSADVTLTNRPITLFATTTGGGRLAVNGSGTLTIRSDLSVPNTGAKTLTLQGSNPGANTFAGIVNHGAGSVSLAKAGAGRWILTGSNVYNTTTITAGTLQLGDGGTTGHLGSGVVTVTAPGLLVFNRSDTITTGMPISGTGAVTKDGAGTLLLGAACTYDGTTTVNTGTLQFGVANALPPAAGDGDVVLSAGAVLDLAGFSGTLAALSGAGTIDTLAAGSPVLTVGINGHSTVFSGGIHNTAGALALTKTGLGALTLAAPSTYSGPTTIASGTLRLGANHVVPNGAGKGDVTVTGVLDLAGFEELINGLSGGGIVTNSTGTATLALGDNLATATFSGSLRDGDGVLALVKVGGGTQTLSGVNTYRGDTIVSNGTLKISAGSAIPDGPGRGNVVVASGGTLDVNTAETINGLAGEGLVNNSLASSRVLTVGGNDQSSLFSGTITNTGAATSLGLTKIGSGTLILAGNNGYGGATTISGGALQVGNGGASGTLGSGAVANTASLVFNRSDTYSVDGVISGAGGTLTQAGAGTLILTKANTYTGATVVNAGTLQVGQAGERIANTSPLSINGGTFDLQGFSETVAAVRLGSGSVVAVGGALTGTVYNVESGTIGATLGGSGAMIKSTAGTVALSSANSYTGGTTVAGGTLLVNNTTGSGTGSGAVSVIDGGVLGGTGTLAGAVTVNAGGTVAPGAGVGTLTVGTLTLGAGSTYVAEFGPGATNDQLVVTTPGGLMIVGGGLSVVTAETATSWTVNGIYPLIQYAGAIDGNGPAALAVLNPQPGKEYVVTTRAGWVVLIISDLGAPQIENLPPSGLSAHGAQLNGFLVSTGGVPTAVALYWGPGDGGTNAAQWAYTNALGTLPVGNFAVTAPPPWLPASQTYFYRSYASNSLGADWADATTNFTTRAESDSTEAAIDPDVQDATSDYGAGPNVVFIDYAVGYVFYVEGPPSAGGLVAYRKTTDGGATWGPPVALGDNQAAGSVGVWYDGWTPGDTGARIHLVHIGTLRDELMYNVFDTARDVIVTNWISVRDGTAWTAGSSPGCAIVKSTAGRLFTYVGGTFGGATNVVSCSDDGQSWSSADVGDAGAGVDVGQLLPLAGGDVALLQQHLATSRFRVAIWTNALSAWSPWIVGGAITANATYDAAWGASLFEATGDLYLAARTNVTAAGALVAYKFGGATRRWSGPWTIADDSARQITSATMLVDARHGDLFAVYARQSAGTIGANPTNVYIQVRHSADEGVTWSAETTVSSLPGQDIRIVRGNLAHTNRLFATWFEEDADDLYGNTVIDLAPTRLRITCNGVANVAPHSAQVKGNLVSEGDSPASVWLYWGSTNAGTAHSQWAYRALLGTPGTGTLSVTVANLADITRYYATYYATNAAGEAWADTIPTFRTPLDRVRIGGTNEFGRNMNYETYGLAWYNQRNESHTYSTAQQGITPIPDDGVQMIQFLAADSDGFNCDVLQNIDLSDYVDAITNGDVRCDFSTYFNSVVAGDRMEIGLWFDASTPGAAGAGSYAGAVVLDGDPATWERVSASAGPVLMPPTTRYVTLTFKIFGTVKGANFAGHFSDKGKFEVFFPILDRPPPPGMTLIVR
ncbi:MAG: autotransporter-associated beta strand repeat-containing protein [Lentisphaerae bacterium]|nr:autotransporter-associated beta strand repeat-containing protein [Lentisphaerota bacterium]